jgi:hypothetical protein
MRHLIPIAAFLMTATAFAQSAPSAPIRERANLRNQRYCEILLVTRHGFSSAEAKVYNTLGLNECPDETWKRMNPKKIAREKGVTAAVLNGPRYFVMDRNGLMSEVGGVDHFDGLDMRALATVQLKSLTKREPYTENTVERKSEYVYEAGKYVYELQAPGGVRYIMQSYSLEIDKTLNESALLNLGSKLKLPKGWKFQARKLDQDLIVRNQGAEAQVLQDNLQNSYQRVQ